MIPKRITIGFVLLAVILAGACAVLPVTGQNAEMGESTAGPEQIEMRASDNTLEAIIESVNSEIGFSDMAAGANYIETDFDYFYESYVELKYLGKCRKIKEPRKSVVNAWLGMLNEQMDDPYLFEKECKFSEGATEYWLPIQNFNLEILNDQFSSGDVLVPGILWIGAAKSSKSTEYIFIISELY